MDRNLRAFMAIADEKTLTGAAQRIGLAQPSLTKRLAQLEHFYDCALFKRLPRGMALTAEGERLYHRAKRIEGEYLLAREEIEATRSAQINQLRIGAGPLFHLRYLAPSFAKTRQKHPHLGMELIAASNVTTFPMLLEGKLDLILGAIDQPLIDDAIHIERLTLVTHGVVVRADDPLCDKGALKIDDLLGRQWITYSENADIKDMLEDYFTRNGQVKPDIAIRSSSFATAMQLVALGGFTMTAPKQLDYVLKKDGLRVLSTQDPIFHLPAGAYIRRSALLYPAVRNFIEDVKDTIESDNR
ncbi:MAG: LysR family transcriptional regulator [Cohaesibacter sp.]|nr:LysR family transcriptional regulator [Cohaesibacter sp.]